MRKFAARTKVAASQSRNEIMAALLKELKENERLAALQYCADLYGFSLVRKARS